MHILAPILLASTIIACSEFTDGGANETGIGPEPDFVSQHDRASAAPLRVEILGSCEGVPYTDKARSDPPLERVGSVDDLALQAPAETLICSETYLDNWVECEMPSERGLVLERDGERLAIIAADPPVIVQISPTSVSCERLEDGA